MGGLGRRAAARILVVFLCSCHGRFLSALTRCGGIPSSAGRVFLIPPSGHAAISIHGHFEWLGGAMRPAACWAKQA